MVLFTNPVLTVLGALASASYAAGSNITQPAPISVDLSPYSYPVAGALYRPAVITPKASIAVYVMHADADYLSFLPCTELQERGYTVFCTSNGASKLPGQTDDDFESVMLAVSWGMNYLKQNLSDEIDNVVLFGHSGGGCIMSAYQNIAENGQSACNGTEKIYPCSSAMSGLLPADGVILADANYGIASMVLLSLGAEIIDETSTTNINESLSLFNVANGYNNTGASLYTPQFTVDFQTAIAKRMNGLVATAEEKLAMIEAGNSTWTDDAPFQVIDAAFPIFNNKFYAQDIRFLARTAHAWPLLHKNGSTTTEVVNSVRVPTNFKAEADSTDVYWGGALITSVKRFLSTYALRLEDNFMYNATDFVGVQWNSSHLIPIGAAPGITVPLLTMGNTGHWEYLNAEKVYLAAGSTDKSIFFLEGADHGFTACTACEDYYNEDYGDTVLTGFNYIASWLGESGRFL